MKPILFFLTPLCVLSAALFGQSEPDTAGAAKDSIIRIIPMEDIGRIEPFSRTSSVITSTDITWKEYRSMYDILAAVPGMFIRDLASPGHANQIMINGIDERNIAVMIDGIPVNDPFTGTDNLWTIPVDAIDKIEIVTSPQSSFYDGISSGGAINIVLKNFFNNRAYTRLRYSQGVDGYTQTDAMFAQNIQRNLNLSFGLTHYGFGSNKESQNYIGRFPNSNDDAWGIRTKLRYDITDNLNISYTYLFNRSWTGLNGGVNYNTSPSIFNGLEARVKNYDAYEKIFNNHSLLTIAFSPGADSSQRITVTGYYFDKLREYRDEENRSTRNGILKAANDNSITKGVKAGYAFNVFYNRFILYLQAEQVDQRTSSPTTTFGVKDEIAVGPMLTISGFAAGSDAINTFGAEGKINFSDQLHLFGGFSYNGTTRSSRIPAIYSHDETIAKLEAGIQFEAEKVFESRISVFRSTINNPIIIDTTGSAAYLKPDQFVYNGISASAHLQWNDFHLEGIANVIQQPSMTRDSLAVQFYPEVTLDGSAYYHGLLAKGNLDLRVGVRGRFVSKQSGMKPFDEFGLWIPSTTVDYGPAATMDFFAVGKIGDAYIHFIWENLTGSQYLLSPIYPMFDRNIRFGVSWEFAD